MNRIVTPPVLQGEPQWTKHWKYETYHKHMNGYAMNVAEWKGTWSVYKHGILLGTGEAGEASKAMLKAEQYVRSAPQVMN